MRAEQFLCFNNNRLYGEVLAPAICILAPSGLADARLRRWYCYCFLLFYVPSMVSGGSVLFFVLVYITLCPF